MAYALINLALFVYSLALAGVLVLFNYYSLFRNATNHTGAPIGLIAAVYFTTFAISVIIMAVDRKKLIRNRKTTYYLLLALAMISSIAFANIVAFDQLNVMMNYETWLHKGMPDKPHLF